jgi:hypothetical protein
MTVIPELVYPGVRKLILYSVYRFWRRFGGDVDELKSEAMELFMEAIGDWTEGSGYPVKAFVRRRVWWGLMDSLEKRCQERRLFKPVPDFHWDLHPSREFEQFDLDSFMDVLSFDARTVAAIALQPPRAVTQLCKKQGSYSPPSMRQAMRSYLMNKGWSKARIDAAFAEVKEAL